MERCADDPRTRVVSKGDVDGARIFSASSMLSGRVARSLVPIPVPRCSGWLMIPRISAPASAGRVHRGDTVTLPSRRRRSGRRGFRVGAYSSTITLCSFFPGGEIDLAAGRLRNFPAGQHAVIPLCFVLLAETDPVPLGQETMISLAAFTARARVRSVSARLCQSTSWK